MKINKIIFIAIIAFIIFSNADEWMDSGTPPPVSSPLAAPENIILSSTMAPDIVKSYAMRAVDNRWPSMDASQSMVVDDLARKNYYLVFDGSGSMRDSSCSGGKEKISVAKKSVTEFISKIPNDANVGLLVFDERGIYERAALGTASRDKSIKAINQVTAGGGTPLKSSIEHAYKSLSKQAEKQLGYGEYHLVVVTDGVASKGQEPRKIVSELINDSPVVLHTIGFCIGGNHSLNQAGLTLYKSANNPQELTQGLDSVLAEATDFDVDSFEGLAQ